MKEYQNNIVRPSSVKISDQGIISSKCLVFLSPFLCPGLNIVKVREINVFNLKLQQLCFMSVFLNYLSSRNFLHLTSFSVQSHIYSVYIYLLIVYIIKHLLLDI